MRRLPGLGFSRPVEPNVLPNKQLLGATIGTIGSGGVLPNGWSLAAADGLTVGVAGFGTADPIRGLPYLDISLSGTTNNTVVTFNVTAASLPTYFPINVSSWSIGWSIALISGANTNVTGWFYQLNALNSSSIFISTAVSSSAPTPTSGLVRSTATTVTPALSAFGQPVLQFTTNNAAAVTATYRVAGFSVNQGPVQPFGASYIVRGGSPPLPPSRGLILPPAIVDRSGNVSLYPDASSVACTGFAPSVDEALLPGAGSIVFTGFAPLGGIEATPAAGSAVFTGFLPDVEGVNPQLEPFRIPVRQPGRGPRPIIPRPVRDYAPAAASAIIPGAGSVVFTGLSPSVDTSLLPGVGSVIFTGQVPSVDEALLPGAGSIVFTGFAPLGGIGAAPGAGSVVFTGLAPSVDTSLLPGAGSVLFTGQAPHVDDTLLPGAGSVVVTGFAPLGGIGAAPGAGSVTFTGFAPLVGIGAAPGDGSIVFTGLSPSADEALLPAVGSVVFTGLVPVVDNQSAGGQTVTPDVGSLTFTGYAPIVPDNVFPSQGNIVFSGYPPDLAQIFAPVFRGGPDDDRRYHDLDRRRRDEDDLEVLLLVTV